MQNPDKQKKSKKANDAPAPKMAGKQIVKLPKPNKGDIVWKGLWWPHQ